MGGFRPVLPSLAAVALFLTASGAAAAPTCQTREGVTARCGTPAAMPVGWTLPDDQRLARDDDKPTLSQVVGLICFLTGFFSLIALMPEFDGSNDRDWGLQEDDDKELG